MAARDAAGPATAVFETNADGCRAAAVLCQFAEYRNVQQAYRTGDNLVLAAALAASPLRGVMDLAGLVDEVRARAIPPNLVRLALMRLHDGIAAGRDPAKKPAVDRRASLPFRRRRIAG